MMKKLFAMLLALMLCAGMIPGMVITASASEADAWDGTTASQAWESGSGTETDPYIIMTAEQLARLAADVNEGTSYAEKYFKLTRATYGLKSFEAMLTFAEHMKKFVPHVVLTIVDKVTPPEEISACQKICDERGLTLRVRPYEDS